MNSISRIIRLPDSSSFFLFGPRGSGKSSLLKERFGGIPSLWLDLLDSELEATLAQHPENLREMIEALPPTTRLIVIDEVQKVPSLLNAVHKLIEKKQNFIFILSGSSARKLKRGGANLLAGRALLCSLDPFVSFELNKAFDLPHALNYGMLPLVWNNRTPDYCQHFLRTYAHTYLKEEIAQEQVVRRLEPFRKFLEVAAQNNGKIVNNASVARDCGVTDKTVAEYYSILEDTLLGFSLEPFHHSFRKRFRMKPKFYLFDTGITRALNRTISVEAIPKTSQYGDLFEHFIVLEVRKLIHIFSPDTRMTFLQTEGGREIDLVLERPGKPLAFVEIKSAQSIQNQHLESLKAIAPDFPNAELFCLCQEPFPRITDQNIRILPWQQGLREIFSIQL